MADAKLVRDLISGLRILILLIVLYPQSNSKYVDTAVLGAEPFLSEQIIIGRLPKDVGENFLIVSPFSTSSDVDSQVEKKTIKEEKNSTLLEDKLGRSILGAIKGANEVSTSSQDGSLDIRPTAPLEDHSKPVQKQDHYFDSASDVDPLERPDIEGK